MVDYNYQKLSYVTVLTSRVKRQNFNDVVKENGQEYRQDKRYGNLVVAGEDGDIGVPKQSWRSPLDVLSPTD